MAQLRFKDNRDIDFPKWERKTLDQLGSFDKGRILSKADIASTGTPMILYGELYTHYGEIATNIERKTNHSTNDLLLSKGGEVILPCSGETPEDISTATCVIPAGVALGGDLIVITPENVDGRILSYIINHQLKAKIASVAQGKSVVHISANSIKNILAYYPVSKDEQQIIAEFLASHDERISIQIEKIASLENRKKGLLQKVFSQTVRFCEDTTPSSEWQEEPLSNLLIEYNEKCPKDGTYEHVSLTKEGVVPKTERYERDFLVASDDKAYRVTHIDDICYNPANLKFGVICRNKYKDAIFSPIYVTFRVTEKSIPAFMELLVTRADFINYALKYQQGTVYERMAVSPEDLLSIKVKIPQLQEQQKIAYFFAAIDEQIDIEKKRLESMQTIKKGFLQQMFCNE